MKDITLNFGAIRDTVARLSSIEILKENKSNSFKTFTASVKKNPVLLKQHYIFKNLEDAKPFTKERLAERFINQNLSILKGIKWQDIINENKKIRLSLLEESHIESNGGKKDELFNSIHTLIESVTKPNFTNIQAEQGAYEYLLEYLMRPVSPAEASSEKIDNPDLNDWKYITKLAVNNFNERYSHLNEEEKKVMSMFLSDDNKKANHIEDLRKENLTLIDNLLKESGDAEKTKLLEGFKEKLNKTKSFDPYSADDFITSYLELRDNLKQM